MVYQFLIDTFLPITIMAVFAVAWIAWVLRLVTFFWGRFRDGRKGKPNPFENKETLGLPKGAIRTFFALSFFSIGVLALASGDRLVLDIDKKWILGELGLIITFYFGGKALDARAESQAKLKAIGLAQSTDEAMKIVDK